MNGHGTGRIILLTLLTCLILFILIFGGLYLRDSMLMREGDINYNAGDYGSALARYRVLQDTTLFKQEALQKADYCNYNLAREAMENEQWEEAKEYLSQVKAFELDSVAKLQAECDKGIEAEADRMRSYDKIFLEDLEKAITLRLDPDDDGDVVVRELMFLKDYDHRYFQDEKLRGYALKYLDALQKRYEARWETYDSEVNLAEDDGDLMINEVLVDLYRDYDFMKDNVQFVGEFVGEYEDEKIYNTALHEVYDDMFSQIDHVAMWPPVYEDRGGQYYHIYRNNTPYHLDVEFRYLRYTGNQAQYLGEDAFHIVDIPPYQDYKVLMTETDYQNGVTFYVDWVVKDVRWDTVPNTAP